MPWTSGLGEKKIGIDQTSIYFGGLGRLKHSRVEDECTVVASEMHLFPDSKCCLNHSENLTHPVPEFTFHFLLLARLQLPPGLHLQTFGFSRRVNYCQGWRLFFAVVVKSVHWWTNNPEFPEILFAFHLLGSYLYDAVSENAACGAFSIFTRYTPTTEIRNLSRPER
ncbi:hypothetical protein SISSUDRAFT_930614 [Sistotremastrum suecicum HHB10207 ss-3]|uniref:Uncharacterized protein n=1 Tax=Sistotremastrum suecicum HHB10207 ss-3 TaxID=1314776 RepID=A0A166BQE6_9AGAM|nr:hypothetical protein SISSUDRAFT_930614 [Sistotremastrum suecicum HHB10207 ss-3]